MSQATTARFIKACLLKTLVSFLPESLQELTVVKQFAVSAKYYLTYTDS